MSERLFRIINEYGDSRFGDEWWPQDARAFMDHDEAARLSAAVTGGRGRVDGKAVALLDEYGRAKFGHKWAPPVSVTPAPVSARRPQRERVLQAAPA